MLLLIDCKDYMLLTQSLASLNGGGAETDKKKEVRISFPPQLQGGGLFVEVAFIQRCLIPTESLFGGFVCKGGICASMWPQPYGPYAKHES